MQALGLIETRGFVAAVEAADSAMKAASVSLVGQRWVGSGLVTVILTGDVAAIKSAVAAGKESASAIGEVVSAQVIASPHSGMEPIIFSENKKCEVTVAPAQNTQSKPVQQAAPKKKSPGV